MPTWRCSYYKCPNYSPFRSTNEFSIRTMRLVDVAQLVCLCLYSKNTVENTAKALMCQNQTVCNCSKRFSAFHSAKEMYQLSTDRTRVEPIQVDESYFSRRRKCNRGWLRNGNQRRSTETSERAELEIELLL